MSPSAIVCLLIAHVYLTWQAYIITLIYNYQRRRKMITTHLHDTFPAWAGSRRRRVVQNYGDLYVLIRLALLGAVERYICCGKQGH
jgi:hypothetical protein